MARSNIEMRGNSGLVYLLGVNAQASNPENIDLSTINPVVDMAMGGYAKLHDNTKWQGVSGGAIDIGGVQTNQTLLLTPGNSIGANLQIVVPINHHFVVWGCSVQFEFNGGGVAAMAGKRFACGLALYPSVSYHTKLWRGEFQVNVKTLQYYDGWACSGDSMTEKISDNHVKIIPAGCQLKLDTWVQDGSNFPAGTIINYFLVGMAIPTGAPIPVV
jgi:hypothetical protein